MGELKDFVIAAHGGLDRWNQLSEVRAHLLIGGVAWALKKQDRVIQDTMVLVKLRRQFGRYYAFGKNGLRTSFTPDRVAIETTAGQVVAERERSMLSKSIRSSHAVKTKHSSLPRISAGVKFFGA